MSTAQHIEEARRFLAQARDSQARDLHGPAWDDCCRAMYAAFSAAISHARETGNPRIYDEAKPSNQINTVKGFKLLPEELIWKAELILERVIEPYHTLVPEDSDAAIEAAEKVIETVEQQVEPVSEN